MRGVLNRRPARRRSGAPTARVLRERRRSRRKYALFDIKSSVGSLRLSEREIRDLLGSLVGQTSWDLFRDGADTLLLLTVSSFWGLSRPSVCLSLKACEGLIGAGTDGA